MENVNFLAYRNAVRQAWKDGKITSGELETLETVRKSLNITLEEHNNIEEEVKTELESQGIKLEKPAMPPTPPSPPPSTNSTGNNNLAGAGDSQAWFNEGKKAYENKQFELAVDYFEKVLVAEPGNNRAEFYKKRSLSKLPEGPSTSTQIGTGMPSNSNGLGTTSNPTNSLSSGAGNPGSNQSNESSLAATPNPGSTSVAEEPASSGGTAPAPSPPASGGGDPNCTSCDGTGECRWCNSTGHCNWCKGEGKCNKCGATGKIGDEECSSCKGTGECFSCKGSGNCFWCKGSGKCSKCNS